MATVGITSNVEDAVSLILSCTDAAVAVHIIKEDYIFELTEDSRWDVLLITRSNPISDILA